jgi:pyrimidine operon attenuation protein/uracil phosphoribosyltransferase
LPIHADIVGKRVDLPKDQRVDVLVHSLDGKDAVILVTP